MNILKKISLWFFGSILSLSLFGFAVSYAINASLANPSELKDSLAASGIYEVPLDSVVENSVEEQMNQNGVAQDYQNKIVGQAVNNAFPDKTLQSSAEQVIDGVFLWLNGEADYPDFRLDFTEERSILINEIADGAVARVETLQACTTEELRAIDINNIDPFSINCRPPIDLALQKQLVVNDLQNNNEFLEEPVISGEKLLEEFTRRDTANIADDVPAGFQWASRMPLLFGLVALVCGVAVLLLSETKRKGLRKIGIVLLSTGLMLVVIQLFVSFLLSKANPGGLNDNPQLEIALIEFAESLTWKFSKPIFIIGGTYIVLGAALLAGLGRKGKDAAPSDPLHKATGLQQSTQNTEQSPRQLDTSGIPAEAPQSETENHD